MRSFSHTYMHRDKDMVRHGDIHGYTRMVTHGYTAYGHTRVIMRKKPNSFPSPPRLLETEQ